MSLLNFYIVTLHLIVIACITFASAIHYHSLQHAIVGLTNGKCTATPMAQKRLFRFILISLYSRWTMYV